MAVGGRLCQPLSIRHRGGRGHGETRGPSTPFSPILCRGSVVQGAVRPSFLGRPGTPPPHTHPPANVLAIGIKVRDKESIDRALRRFKRTVNRARVLRIYRENMAFTKPSEVEREKRKEAAKKARRANRRRY